MLIHIVIANVCVNLSQGNLCKFLIIKQSLRNKRNQTYNYKLNSFKLHLKFINITVIHINAPGRCILHSINLKFRAKARFFICDKI